MVFLNNDELADRLIIHGEMHTVNKLIPSPQQCSYCQRPPSPACPAKQREEPPTCARCALPHLTASCQCPRSPKCPDVRSCQPKCANCGGEHRSIDHTCPTKLTEVRKIMNNPKYASPYFTSAPDASPHPDAITELPPKPRGGLFHPKLNLTQLDRRHLPTRTPG